MYINFLWHPKLCMPFILYSIWHYVGFLVVRHIKIVAGRSRHSISFLNENLWVKSLAGRSCHLVSIFDQNLHLTLRSCHFTSFFRQISDFCAIEGEEGHTMCFFQATKGRSTWARHKGHASLPGPRLHSSGTLLPFSYETSVLPMPLSRRDEDLAGYVFKMRMSI